MRGTFTQPPLDNMVPVWRLCVCSGECPLLPWPRTWLPVTPPSVGHRTSWWHGHIIIMETPSRQRVKISRTVSDDVQGKSFIEFSKSHQYWKLKEKLCSFQPNLNEPLATRPQQVFLRFSKYPGLSMNINVYRMLNSPKMQRIQRSVRINEGQLLGLAEKARWRIKYP